MSFRKPEQEEDAAKLQFGELSEAYQLWHPEAASNVFCVVSLFRSVPNYTFASSTIGKRTNLRFFLSLCLLNSYFRATNQGKRRKWIDTIQ